MNYTKGYYSLVQYCPDESRAEAVNLGVVLFCPDRAFLDVITSSSNERVRRLFKGAFDSDRLNDAKAALANRLRHEREGRIQTQEDFVTFAHSRANGLLMTAPRPLKVANPADELGRLYESLVMEGTARIPVATSEAKAEMGTPQKSRLRQRLNHLFRNPKVQQVRVEDPTVVVPLAGTTLKAPYGFQNGKLNLIYPLQFNKSTSQKALELAAKGDLLHKHEAEMETPAALWITLPIPEDIEREQERDQVEALFYEYKIPVFREENFNELERKVEAIIH